MPDELPSQTTPTYSPPNVPLITSLPPEVDAAIKTLNRFVTILSAQRKESPSVTLQKILALDTTVPLGWTGKGHYPYYKKEYAEKVKQLVDLMVKEESNRLLIAKDFGVSSNTLHCMIIQGWLYLQERLDTPENTYKLLRDRIEVCKESNNIRLRWKNKLVSSAGFLNATGSAEEIDISPKFKDELILWLETGEDETKFERNGLKLSEEQIAMVRDLTEGVPNIFIIKLSASNISIARSSRAAALKGALPQ